MKDLRFGMLFSRIRVEEKLLIEAAQRRGIEFVMVDSREAVFDLDSRFDYDVLLERDVSHARALYALNLFENSGIQTINRYDVALVCGVDVTHRPDHPIDVDRDPPHLPPAHRLPQDQHYLLCPTDREGGDKDLPAALDHTAHLLDKPFLRRRPVLVQPLAVSRLADHQIRRQGRPRQRGNRPLR